MHCHRNLGDIASAARLYNAADAVMDRKTRREIEQMFQAELHERVPDQGSSDNVVKLADFRT